MFIRVYYLWKPLLYRKKQPTSLLYPIKKELYNLLRNAVRVPYAYNLFKLLALIPKPLNKLLRPVRNYYFYCKNKCVHWVAYGRVIGIYIYIKYGSYTFWYSLMQKKVKFSRINLINHDRWWERKKSLWWLKR